ncbi:histone-lysine N-methyltransferase SMYD3 [Favolaschia claudopus]|uniref:Histone-lysine N-methyltransferase SMYD3 n=1 Tax=Favolaschia claudopus TaxID=2862362 RepID=A0AAW0C032_9AGAR
MTTIPEPKAMSMCDFGLCPHEDYNTDSHPEQEARKTLMRCSTCKNRFYCSARCQKKDWKEHKWNCSALNATPPTSIEIDDEFRAEKERVVLILKDVAAALKDDKNKLTASMIAPLLEITATLPPRLQYPRPIQDSEKFKFRLPIVTACRLLLISYVSALDDTQKGEFVKFFAGMELPSSFCEMYGPKIAGRPADLSAGEYAMLGQVMPMWVIGEGMRKVEVKKAAEKDGNAVEEGGEKDTEDDGAGSSDKGKAKAAVEEGVEAVDENENEKDGEEWIWLAVMLKRVYNATSR